MAETFVVVGAGLAAAKAVEGLREAGFEATVVMFGEEHHLPYERPPLSKGYLLGTDELESAFVHDPDWYDENDVDLRLGTAVTSIDLAAHTVHTRDGQQAYDRLLLATGASPRHLAAADESGAPVAYLRTIEDSQRLKESFGEGGSVVVVGGGWSIVAEQCDLMVGHGCAGPLSPGVVEVGLVVEDAHQGTGIGARLTRDLAVEASRRGFSTMVCLAQPDNDSVVRTVRRAGLDCVPTLADGLLEVQVALPARRGGLQRPA